MKLSYNWLKEYLNINISPEELSNCLTMAGFEVSGIERRDGDNILDIELTVNRGDCLSMIGMAREIAAIQDIKMQMSEIPLLQPDIPCDIDVILDEKVLCPRYTARVIQGIKVEPSPPWLQEKLKVFDIRPVNNIVDITNFCLAELGHPMHAFDYNLIKGKKIIIRKAYDNERFVTLDDHICGLTQEMLVIADEEKAIALAGIIGGKNTGVSENTSAIIMECAYFSPISIRNTTRKLNIQTESSYRFERGVDYNGVIYAQERAAELILKLCKDAKISEIIDVYPEPKSTICIPLRIERANKILGVEITPEEMRNILIRLGFNVAPIIFHAYTLDVEVPSFRTDITREIDLIEEIARIYGYDKIPATLPPLISIPTKTQYQLITERIKNILCACGLYEVITYAFIDPNMLDRMKISSGKNVSISNPLSEEDRLLTHSLIPNLLRVIAYNVAKGINEVKIFEIARVFTTTEKDTLPEEKMHLGIMMIDEEEYKMWDGHRKRRMDFYELSGILKLLFEELGITDYTLSKTDKMSLFHPGRCAIIEIKDIYVGVIGQLHPDITTEFKLPEDIYTLEVDLETVVNLANITRISKPLSKYPVVVRDMALIVKLGIRNLDIIKVIQDTGKELIEDIKLFDVYTGEHIPSGYRSLAYSITYRSYKKTLTDEEVSTVHQKIISELKRRLGVSIR
jgi:phenylalanyl-tRNA synthetase beta chain